MPEVLLRYHRASQSQRSLKLTSLKVIITTLLNFFFFFLQEALYVPRGNVRRGKLSPQWALSSTSWGKAGPR